MIPTAQYRMARATAILARHTWSEPRESLRIV